MTTIRVDFLRGQYVAAEPTAAASPEWPPAPARVFGALVSSAYQLGLDPEPLTALESAPEIRHGDATAAVGGTNYVPAAFIKGGRPNRDIRRPQMVGIDAPVFYRWDAELDPEWLRQVLSGVTYLGRAESTSVLTLTDDPPDMPHHLAPDTLGDELLRVPQPGWLAQLQASYGTRARIVAPYVGYADPRESVIQAPWGELFALRASGELSDAVQLGEALRAATMSHAPEQMSPVLHGHEKVPHAAWVTLPNVGHTHADGRVLGVGMLLPRGVSEADRTEAVSALVQVAREGRAGAVAVRRGGSHEQVPAGLQGQTWARRGTTWATATPVVLERARGDAATSIADTCERWGYPRPAAVEVSQHSPLPGVPPARRFRPRRPGRWTHAVVHWDMPIRGPVLLGRDQHFGLGLLRAVHN